MGLTTTVRTDGLRIDTDLPALERQLREFGKRKVLRAQVSAMNASSKKGRVAAKRLIARARFLKPADVGNALEVKNATLNKPQARIIGKGRPLSLTQLKTGLANPKQTSRGVKVRTRTGGRVSFIKSAFITKFPKSGHIAVAVRKKNRRTSRLPIVARRLPSIAHTLVGDEVGPNVTQTFQDFYGPRFEQNLRKAIARAQARITN